MWKHVLLPRVSSATNHKGTSHGCKKLQAWRKHAALSPGKKQYSSRLERESRRDLKCAWNVTVMPVKHFYYICRLMRPLTCLEKFCYKLSVDRGREKEKSFFFFFLNFFLSWKKLEAWNKKEESSFHRNCSCFVVWGVPGQVGRQSFLSLAPPIIFGLFWQRRGKLSLFFVCLFEFFSFGSAIGQVETAIVHGGSTTGGMSYTPAERD